MKLAAAVLFWMAAAALYAAESHKPIRTIRIVGNRTAALCNASVPALVDIVHSSTLFCI